MADTEYLTIGHIDRKQLAKLFGKIAIDKATGCWLWRAAKLRRGYGQAWVNGRRELAHRLMFAWLVHPIPKGVGRSIHQLDHVVCSNTSCCNPAHLALVPPKVNALRSSGVSAINAAKTTCPNGHDLPAGPNNYSANGGFRLCRICRNAWLRARYEADRKSRLARQMAYEAKMSAVPGWRDRRNALARASYARRKKSG